HTYIAKYKLPTLNEAIIWMHFPASELHLKQARRRFVYEELLLFQIKMQLLRKISRESEYGEGIKIDEKVINELDRKSTRLNSSHVSISYAVFCLKKKKK